MEIYPDEGFAIFVVGQYAERRSAPERPCRARCSTRSSERSPRAAARRGRAAPKRPRSSGPISACALPSYRSERPLLRMSALFECKALPSGDILVGGPNVSADRRRRVRRQRQPPRIAFHRAGTARCGSLTQRASSRPTDRLFRAIPLAAIDHRVATLAACWSIVDAARRLDSGRRPGTRRGAGPRRPLPGLAGGRGADGQRVWPWIKDGKSAIFTYPGVLYPLACWSLLAAALGNSIGRRTCFRPVASRRLEPLALVSARRYADHFRGSRPDAVRLGAAGLSRLVIGAASSFAGRLKSGL